SSRDRRRCRRSRPVQSPGLMAPTRGPEGESRRLVGAGVLVAAAVALANAANAGFQLALARLLDPAEYSLLAALFTIVLIAQAPTIAFQASLARELAGRLAAG